MGAIGYGQNETGLPFTSSWVAHPWHCPEAPGSQHSCTPLSTQVDIPPGFAAGAQVHCGTPALAGH